MDEMDESDELDELDELGGGVLTAVLLLFNIRKLRDWCVLLMFASPAGSVCCVKCGLCLCLCFNIEL